MTDREKLDSIFRLLKGVKDESLTPEVAALGRQIIEIIDPKIAAECCFCHTTTANAVDAGFDPDFFDGPTYHDKRVCPACSQKYIGVSAGERFLKKGSPKPS